MSADAVVHVTRLSLLCFGLSDKQLMPRVSTSVAIASLGIWRTGNWVRGTFGFIGWKVLENLVLEIQIFLLKKKLKILAIESIVILSPFALGILAAVASIIWWILIVVVAIFKLLATSIFGLAKIVTQYHDFIGTRLLSWSLDRFHRHYRHLDQFVHTEDRSPLTFSSCMEAVCFVIIARGNEWDEVLLVSQHEGSEWLCYTTTPDGSRFMWSLLKMTLGNFRGVEGRDQNRGPAGGIRAADVNWLCHPENLGVKWAPTAPQLVSLVAEGRTIMDIIKQEPVPAAPCGRFSNGVGGVGASGTGWSISISSAAPAGHEQFRPWSSNRRRSFRATKAGRCGEFNPERPQSRRQEEKEEKEEERSQFQFWKEEKEQEERPIQLKLFDILFGELKFVLHPLEARGEEQKGGRCQDGQGGYQTLQETQRPFDFCLKTPRSPHGKLHQCGAPEAHEGWYHSHQPTEGCGAHRVCDDWVSRSQGSQGQERSHDYPSSYGPHQQVRDQPGNGHFVNADCGIAGSQDFGWDLGESLEEGTHPRRGVNLGPSRSSWNELIGGRGLSAAKSVRALAAGNSCASVLDILSDMISADDGHLGRMIRNFSGKQKSRPLGVAGDEIFPLPLMFPSPLPRKGRSRLRTRRRNSLISHVNICIVAFNWLYAGKEGGSLLSPSAVQRRIHAVIFEAVDSFLRSGSSTSGEAEISGFLRESQHAYWTTGGHCLPLGLRAGVPEKAAVVDLHNILQKFDIALAKQIIHPGELLLPPRLRPRKLPRPFCKLDGTYGEYVKRNCKAGLQKLKPLKTIFKIKGKPLFSGAFAVAKNIEEDRAISALCPLNALVDQRKLWVPKFAIMSSMRAMTLARDKQLRVYKKDARHFFHFLRVGTRWHKYMAHPPLPSDGHHPQMYPVHQGVPMGFTAAAAWAQAYNEQKAREAELPVDSRLVDGKPPPSGFPIWGSILDDVWAIEEES